MDDYNECYTKPFPIVKSSFNTLFCGLHFLKIGLVLSHSQYISGLGQHNFLIIQNILERKDTKALDCLSVTKNHQHLVIRVKKSEPDSNGYQLMFEHIFRTSGFVEGQETTT